MSYGAQKHQVLYQKVRDSNPELSICFQAVDLYVASKQALKALELCLKYNIKMSEDMAEKLSAADVDNDEKLRILNKIAEVAYQQGHYHLATKKWTQAGNRLQAMKALLKSGDTDKIIFFANVSRQREIYILAGNYLQTLDWRNNADIMKNIIAFYTKSKTYDLLAMFYQVSCCQCCKRQIFIEGILNTLTCGKYDSI